jgi:hypothetical protein
MRTSFHHQPEAQHPIFQLSTSWQADYPIFRGKADMACRMDAIISAAFDPKETFSRVITATLMNVQMMASR